MHSTDSSAVASGGVLGSNLLHRNESSEDLTLKFLKFSRCLPETEGPLFRAGYGRHCMSTLSQAVMRVASVLEGLLARLGIELQVCA